MLAVLGSWTGHLVLTVWWAIVHSIVGLGTWVLAVLVTGLGTWCWLSFGLLCEAVMDWAHECWLSWQLDWALGAGCPVGFCVKQ